MQPALCEITHDQRTVVADADEVGHQRHRAGAAHEFLQQKQVVGAVADIRLKAAALAADAHHELALAGPGLPSRPGRGGELCQRHALAFGQRVGGWQQQADLLVHEVLALASRWSCARAALVFVAQQQVDRLQAQRRQRLLELGLDHVDLHAGVCACERADRRCDELQRAGLKRRDAHATGDRAARAGEVSLGGLDAAKSVSAWPTSICAASVSRTLRPARSSSGTPASRSSTASCWETAEGV